MTKGNDLSKHFYFFRGWGGEFLKINREISVKTVITLMVIHTFVLKMIKIVLFSVVTLPAT